MKDLRMAACGIDCGECASYKVTTQQDVEAAQSLVSWYKSRGWIGENEGAEAVLKKNPLCTGCWNTGDGCFFTCGCHPNRDFRVCCTEKHIAHCGECGEFPCVPYTEFVGDLAHHKEAMEHLISLRGK